MSMQTESIKNIIFDFGNVLIQIDPQLSFDQLSMQSDIPMEQFIAQNERTFHGFERGDIDEITFYQSLGFSIEEGRNSWNAMLLHIPAHIFSFLADLRQRYRLYLYSNTNKSHMDWIYNYLDHTYQIKDWDDRFDGTYYSHLMGTRKPELDGFQQILSDHNLIAEQTLFIDDNADNVQAAQQAGMKAILHDPRQDIADMITEYLS